MQATILALAAALSLTGQGFAPIGEHDGVIVYRRDHTGGIELAAEGDIAAAPERVRRVLLDYVNHPRWVKGLAMSRVLAHGPGFVDVYQRLDLPVLADRDYTLHVTWGEDADGPWLRFVTANERGPAPVRGVVRVRLHEGGWRFAPVDGGRATHATYWFHLDLAGAFPAWMGKGRAARDVPGLFENVRHQLQYYR